VSRWWKTETPVATRARPSPPRMTRTPLWRVVGTGLRLDALDVGAEPAQALVDPLVAPVDLADVADRGETLRAEAREQHRHSGADVGARQPFAVQLRRAGDDDPVRVADDDPRAHVHQLVDEEKPALEHLLEDEHRPSRLRRDHDRDRRQVGGKGGPGAVVDLRDVAAEIVADLQVLPVRDADPSPL